MEAFIERVPADQHLVRKLTHWKWMRATGWELTVLVDPDHKTVIAFGYRREGVTVKFPRTPKSYQMRLLATLGADWEIDPDAPELCPCGCWKRGNDYSIRVRKPTP